MKKTNNKLKLFLQYCILGLIGFSAAFIMSFSIIRCINEFVTIDLTLFSVVVFILSVILSIINLILYNRNYKHDDSNFVFWKKKHSSKIVIGYFMLLFVFSSIKNSVRWANDEVNNIMSIEWTIMGLSITIFLVWEIFLNYLKSKQPVAENNSDFVQMYQYLQDKFNFAQKVETGFSSIVLLSANLLLIVITTTAVYIMNSSQSIITQNLIACNFYFSTNTITMLFLNILQPIIEEKRILKQNNQVTKKEMDEANANAKVQMIVEGVTQYVDQLNTLNDEEKAIMKGLSLKVIKEIILKKTNSK